MCGIAGCYQTDEWDVEAALEMIGHRGPDGRGVARVKDATHGHVRLAIMDPKPRSDQPFQRWFVVLSYVGELWNAPDLRKHLTARGYEFITTGDTEVLAAALTEWGEEALPRLEGQYAFAWTDIRSGVTRLARDRFGEVPLYVLDAPAPTLFDPGGIMWASERKAWGAQAHEAEPVPAGCVVTLRDGGGLDHWWYYDRARDAARCREGAAGGPEDVLGILERSVDRRLQSDVPVCCLISGGVDSSAILALTKRRMPDVVAYTIVFDEDAPDLLEARFVADHLGVELREVPVPRPTLDVVRESVRAIEITMKAQIEIAVHCLPLAERIYADGFRVVLSGEGADELFGGYGMLARRSKGDWPGVRLEGVEKMDRGNFVRINKAFMSAGVEARTPYMDREMVEAVLPLTREECPEQKKLLRAAVKELLPERTWSRHKVSFQSGSGMRAAAEAEANGEQQKVYNRLARELFGGLPRG